MDLSHVFRRLEGEVRLETARVVRTKCLVVDSPCPFNLFRVDKIQHFLEPSRIETAAEMQNIPADAANLFFRVVVILKVVIGQVIAYEVEELSVINPQCQTAIRLSDDHMILLHLFSPRLSGLFQLKKT